MFVGVESISLWSDPTLVNIPPIIRFNFIASMPPSSIPGAECMGLLNEAVPSGVALITDKQVVVPAGSDVKLA